ncbi:MAG TPA: molybdopterin cofactor-binding domain-containing protein [Baekduia sp.]|uniref:molybdopterin cofactor-binding domain-containing protein n=1 Tax=Baekduia sp. TaxID=2600305 RepID=UPI002BFFCE1C|nr:molybdopterin cofactor-binding domain-containing protein [Baekduia sp.]HMJ32980.1 molybdopterin cofactor-binding domain-containing protein [Baekduia sp.]
MSPQQGDHAALLRERDELVRGRGLVGERLARSDGPAKVAGAFAYSSDLHVDDMLFGATLRSPHAAARIRSVDTAAARAIPGVRAVLTHADVPGHRLVGSVMPDQPVLAIDRVRHHGEPVAIVAADDPATARRAAATIMVDYAPEAPLTTVEAALAPGAPALHPGGNVVRSVPIVRGDPDAAAPVVVRGRYEVGMQDQAFLGPESGLAIPDGEGGVELHVATQWLHADRDQVAAGLGLAPERVRIVLAGVGGAFGAREDLSMQLHACLLALATGRAVKMSYLREESFAGGHVHRHPAWMEYEHRAGADGRLVVVRARLWLDGGAYASSSSAVIANATTLAVGPYAVDNVDVLGVAVYTNNQPCGAMRGFGAVQVAVAYEAQMDRVAQAVGIDPVELRRRNALAEGGRLPTGQAIRGPVATVELLDRLAALPPPVDAEDDAGLRDPRTLPGSTFGATLGEGVRRGVGYAVGFKNIAFSEGFDDPASARVALMVRDGRAVAEVHTAATEVGQGVLGVQEQIVRTELGVADVRVLPADTAVDSAGSASASRLTWMVGGAVRAACAAVRTRVLERAAHALGGTDGAVLALRDGHVLRDGEPAFPLAELLAGAEIEETRTYRHDPTEELDPLTGQGDSHAGFAFVAHRATVDVDVELGLARVVELACAQDVGRAINPLALEGQLEGGSIQGLGLALTEELLVAGGIVQNRSFGSYRIPTIVDAAPVPTIVLELGDPATPYGLRGAGEMPAISATPAILAALRAATGLALTRAPVRPEDLVVGDERSGR